MDGGLAGRRRNVVLFRVVGVFGQRLVPQVQKGAVILFGGRRSERGRGVLGFGRSVAVFELGGGRVVEVGYEFSETLIDFLGI